jgi:hypothetical protein
LAFFTFVIAIVIPSAGAATDRDELINAIKTLDEKPG